MLSMRLLKADLSSRHRYDGVAIRAGERDMGVVLVRIDVEMIWLRLLASRPRSCLSIVILQLGLLPSSGSTPLVFREYRS